MKEYVYFCKNCRRLVVDDVDNSPFRCDDCGGKYQPLHVTLLEWKTASNEEKREILNNSVGKGIHRNNVSQKKNTHNSSIKKKAYVSSQYRIVDKMRYCVDKISTGEKGKNSKLSIAGFILSFLGFFSIFGLAAGIIDLIKKDGRKKGFSIATICISVIVFLTSLGIAVGSSEEPVTDGIVAESITEENISQDKFDDGLDASVSNASETINSKPTDEVNDVDLTNVGDETEMVSEESNVEEEPEAVTRTLYTTSKVNIREQPNTDCAVLGKAEIGQEVTEYEAGADGWSRVACKGVEGYIKSEYLTQVAPSPSVSKTEETAAVVSTEPIQSTPVPTPEAASAIMSVPEMPAAVAQTPVVATPVQPVQQVQSSVPPTSDTMVWLSATGSKYHKINNCGNMNPNRARQVPLSEAIVNYKQCSDCW